MEKYVLLGLFFLVLEVLYLLVAKKLCIVDRPHHQSSHTGVVVRGGGIIFYIAYLVWFILSGMHSLMIFIGLSIMALVSFIDDIRSVNPSILSQIGADRVLRILDGGNQGDQLPDHR